MRKKVWILALGLVIFLTMVFYPLALRVAKEEFGISDMLRFLVAFGISLLMALFITSMIAVVTGSVTRHE